MDQAVDGGRRGTPVLQPTTAVPGWVRSFEATQWMAGTAAHQPV